MINPTFNPLLGSTMLSTGMTPNANVMRPGVAPRPTLVSAPTDIRTDIQPLMNITAPQTVGPPKILRPRPVQTNYSRTNLPTFMQGRTEVSPGLFSPNQGLLGVAPVGVSDQYISDYADLERAFQESFASRPEYFNTSYDIGQFVPGLPSIDLPAEEDASISLEELALAGLATSKPARDMLDVAIDETLQPADDIRDFLDENIIESRPVQFVEDVVQEGLSNAKDFAQDIYQSQPVSDFREGVESIADTITYPVKAAVDQIQNIIPEGLGSDIQKAKDDLIKATKEKLGIEGDLIPNLQRKFEGVVEAYGAIGDIALGLESPSFNNMKRAIEGVENLNMLARGQQYTKVADFTPKPIQTEFGTLEMKPVTAEAVTTKPGYEPMQPELVDDDRLISPGMEKALLTAASAYNIAGFAKDPTLEGAPSAAASSLYLADEYGSSIGINEVPQLSDPFVQGPLAAANVYGGLKALEGGIDSPAEFASAINAIPSAAYLGSLALGDTALGMSLETLGGMAGGEFAPFAPGSLAGPLALASLVQVAPDLMQGSALGDFPRFEAEIGLTNGNFDVVDKESFDAGIDFYAGGQATNAVEFANYMINNLGYEIDQEAYKDFKASDKDMIVDDYAYFTKKHQMKDPSYNAASFVASLLGEGVLVPTENTPRDFSINEAIKILDPEVSYYSPQEQQFASRNTNVDYILGEMYGFPTAPTPEMTPELMASLPGFAIPDTEGLQAFIETLPTTGIPDDPRTRLREDTPLDPYRTRYLSALG